MNPQPCSVIGWGSALPDTVVTNADLESRLDTTDEWVTERTGIRERRVGGSVSELATRAGRLAIERSGCTPQSVDLLVLATTTPDHTVPATSARVQHSLGLSGGAFDLNAACAGFVYGIAVAAGALATGSRRVLVVGADCLSRITDQSDRSTAVLFADGAGAVLLEAGDPGGRPGALLGVDLGVDGSAYDLLLCPHGGYLSMEGREVFRRAVRVTAASAARTLDAAGIAASEVSLFVPHQANLRIIEAAAERIGISMERTAIVLDRTGNTSAASIPLALAEAAGAGRISPGDIVLLSGFGAGMTWASALLRWGDAA